MEVNLKNICKHFGKIKAVDSVDLKINDGKFIALLGPSGCGKTTTLLMIAGIYKPTTGDIYFGDKIVNEVLPKDRKIGMVFQSYALYPHMRELLEVVERVNKKNVGICCDFGHAFLSFKGDEPKFLKFVEKTLPYLKHIHAHDNFGISKPDIEEKLDYRLLLPYGIGDLHMPPGMGKIPYQKIKPLLRDYSGIILMEVRYRYIESYSSILNMEF